MRLLTTTGEPRLKTFMDEEKMPEYAILSHCWMDDDEEVVFSDLASLEEAKTKPGWQKLDYARQQAARDDYEWLWADTVCIDKSSSAELSEAINSMFKWYKESAVCYVYLADVSAPDTIIEGLASCYNVATSDIPEATSRTKFARDLINWRDDTSSDSSTPESELPDSELDREFRRSKWFTRGWTLQEMLAPKSLRFYSAGWTFLGTRWDLRRLVTRCTRVPFGEDVEQDREDLLLGASAARRMSWAAGRKTTRAEDRAYSLLGIFGVNMPIIYGEGENAFLRLQQEIFRRSSDQSLLAWNELAGSWTPFASSPDSFKKCADIVPLQRSQYNYWEVTDTGIRLRLPLLETESGAKAVVMLQCRDTSNPEAGIVLRKYYVEKGTGDDFIARSVDDSTNLKLLHDLGIEAWVPQQWPPRNITFLFNPPLRFRMRPGGQRDTRLTTLLVRSGTNHPARYKDICRAEPSTYWDETNHSFSIPRVYHSELIFEALLTFVAHNGEKRDLCVFLFVQAGDYLNRFDLQFVHNAMPDWKQEGIKRQTQFFHLVKTEVLTTACTLANGNTLEARMWIGSVLDQNLAILSVEEKATAQTCVEQADIDDIALQVDCGTIINEIEPSEEDVKYVMSYGYVCHQRALTALRKHKEPWDSIFALKTFPICSQGKLLPKVVSFHGRTLKEIYACKLCCDAPSLEIRGRAWQAHMDANFWS